jgi:hypothetical protein
MLVYQYSRNWKSFALWNAVAAGVISAVFFPVLVALDIIGFSNWNPLYDFPFIFTFGIAARAVVLGVMRVEANLRDSHSSSTFNKQAFQPAFKPLIDKNHHEDK